MSRNSEGYSYYNFHPKYQKLGITYLCLANDLLIYSRGDTSSVKLLKDRFDLFLAASSLEANLSKSLMYLGGVNRNTKGKML